MSPASRTPGSVASAAARREIIYPAEWNNKCMTQKCAFHLATERLLGQRRGGGIRESLSS